VKRTLESTAITRGALLALVALVVWSPAGCSEHAEPAPRACTTAIAADTCAPLYEPTFANVFDRTLKPSCGIGGAACHTARARQGGLAFEDADEAFRGLHDGKIHPGDPACSALVVRLTASDPNVRMPPGRSISVEEQCAVARWIAEGAKR